MSSVLTTLLLAKYSTDQYRDPKEGKFGTPALATEHSHDASAKAARTGLKADHLAAAKAHDKASKAHRLAGNKTMVQGHKAAAQRHRKIASTLGS